MNKLGFREAVVLTAATTVLQGCPNTPTTPEIQGNIRVEVKNNTKNPEAKVQFLTRDSEVIGGKSIIEAREDQETVTFKRLPEVVRIRVNNGSKEATSSLVLLDITKPLSITIEDNYFSVNELQNYSYSTGTTTQATATPTPSVSASTVPQTYNTTNPSYCPEIVNANPPSMVGKSNSEIILELRKSVTNVIVTNPIGSGSANGGSFSLRTDGKLQNTDKKECVYPNPVVVNEKGQSTFVQIDKNIPSPFTYSGLNKDSTWEEHESKINETKSKANEIRRRISSQKQ